MRIYIESGSNRRRDRSIIGVMKGRRNTHPRQMSKAVLRGRDATMNCNIWKYCITEKSVILTLKVLVETIDAQWEGMGDVGSARYEPALLPPCPTIRVLSCSN